jgi:hypothetical protein
MFPRVDYRQEYFDAVYGYLMPLLPRCFSMT